ncbi:hypothetical protein EDB19DRAFT_1914004 [Suillus lakei]|nr:hypothetical protein EDB19DRAFT_1914004 [Suillus lakei]
MPVQYFSAEQCYWLDNQIDMYKYCDEHNDLVDFWTSLFEIFFTCWPEHEVLFPDGPAPQDFTEEQRQAVDKAVVTRKHRLHAWFHDQRTLHTDALEGYVPFTIVSTHDHTMVLQVEEAFVNLDIAANELDVEGVGSDVEAGGSG